VRQRTYCMPQFNVGATAHRLIGSFAIGSNCNLETSGRPSMTLKLIFYAACITMCSMVVRMAGADSNAEVDIDIARIQPLNFINDSPIKTAVKEKMAAAQLPSLATIKIGIDEKNFIWLSGTAGNQAQANLAEEIARTTVGVVAVNNNIRVRINEGHKPTT
jgi:hypothetical protein